MRAMLSSPRDMPADSNEVLVHVARCAACKPRCSCVRTNARLFANRHASPQPFLWGLAEVAWQLVLRLRPYRARRPRRVGPDDHQLRLLP